MKWGFLGLVAVAFAGAASAQLQSTTTTNCHTYGFGSVQCTSTTPQQPQNQVNWGLLQPPDYAKTAREGFEAGVRIRLMLEQQRLIAEQRRMLEQRTYQQIVPPTQPARPPVRLSCNLSGKPMELEISETEGTVQRSIDGRISTVVAMFGNDAVSWREGSIYTMVSRHNLSITRNDVSDVMKVDIGTCTLAQRQF